MTDQTQTAQTPAALPQIKINGIIYNVEKRETAQDYTDRGLAYLAAEMSKHHTVAAVYIRRPRGKSLYTAWEFSLKGQTFYSSPISLNF